jgi:ABC-type nitrate/sulfonate/bicarbonate transport system permease component
VRVLNNRWVLRAAALAVILAAWQWALGRDGVDPTLAAPPSRVVQSIPEVLSSDLYVRALGSTLKLFALGYGISAVLGILVGFLVARIPFLDTVLTPYVNGLYAAPLPALVPIITAVLGFLLAAKLLIVVLLGIFPILINAHQGAKDTDHVLLEVARSFKASELRTWGDVILPGSLPYLLVGLRLGAARALIGTVVAELYTSPDGLGYLMLRYGSAFDMDAMLVVVLTLTAMGLLLSGGILLLDRRFAKWKVSD